MSESPSTVNWNNSKVEAKPDIATNSLSDNITAVINYKNAKHIRIQELTDSKILSEYEDLEGYDLSYLLKSNNSFDIELPFTSKEIHILFIPVLLSDVDTYVSIYIDSTGTRTHLDNTRIYDTTTQQTKTVYYINERPDSLAHEIVHALQDKHGKIKSKGKMYNCNEVEPDAYEVSERYKDIMDGGRNPFPNTGQDAWNGNKKQYENEGWCF